MELPQSSLSIGTVLAWTCRPRVLAPSSSSSALVCLPEGLAPQATFLSILASWLPAGLG
jgi:hypothetical protein